MGPAHRCRGEQAKVVEAETAASLRVLRDAGPAAARRLFGDALLARELLYRLFSALVAGSAIEDEAAPLAAMLAAAPARQDLVLRRGLAGWRVAMITPSAGELLAPVL